MNKYDFALSFIRAPWLKRISDRSFLLAVAAGAIGLYLFQQKAIDGQTLVALIGSTWAPWILGSNAKDAIAIHGALKGNAPDTVNAGGEPVFQDSISRGEVIPSE